MKKGLLALILLNQLSVLAFDFKVGLNNKIFNKKKYNFSVAKFIDGRLNKQKPIGYIPTGFSFKPHTVGNDSLEEILNVFFKQTRSSFDSDTKIIVVLNQLNVSFGHHINAMGNVTGQEEFRMTASFDYYKINGNLCSLVYQQYFKYIQNVTFTGPQKGITAAFSKTLKLAFEDFDTLVIKQKLNSSLESDTSTIYSFLHTKPSKIINNSNINDGIYFSCKDVYLNKPGLASYIAPDTSILGKKPIYLKSGDSYIDKVYAIVKNKRVFIYIKDNYYKEAFFDDKGNLYFPDVTSTSISGQTLSATVAIGVFSAFVPFSGIIKSVATSTTQNAIVKSKTTKTTSDVIVDFETGDLTFKE